MCLIKCENLCIGYEKNVLGHNINFSIEDGDYICIVGKNGSGKSTLMKTLLKLQKPIAGKISYDRKINSFDIGYLPQQTEIQRDFPASVQEIVLSGLLNKKKLWPFYTKEEKNKAFEAMVKMQIQDLQKRCFRELSGGQQQRVLLARALCATNKILMLDEPIAGLDPKATSDMYKLIERMNKEDHITIIMISHDLNMALNYASHILQLGKNLFFGNKENFLRQYKEVL